MPSYSETIKSLVQETQAFEQNLPVRNSACRSQFFLQSHPTDKVCIFFHGFTAGPYQFVPMGQAFFKAGYNVIIPLLPGHGRAGNWNRQILPPLPTDSKVYQNFGLEWLQKAQTLGKRVIIGGLSAGGTLAGWLTFERSQMIYRTLLFAPYLGSMSMVLDLYVRQSQGYFEWGNPGGNQAKGLGYSGFAVPALAAVMRMGESVLDRSEKQLAAPTFIISSEADFAVRNLDHRFLFEQILKRQPKAWCYRFPKTLKVPHTMMTKAEGNQYEQLLITVAKSYVESDLTWKEVEAIAIRMTQGKIFNTAVSELGLTQKVSPDMAAMMTLIDKREIIMNQNPSF